MKRSLLCQIFRSMMIPGFHVAITINPVVLLFDIHASQLPSIYITVCDRKCAEKMLLLEFKSKDISNPCYFHYQYLHGNSAGHHIKPNLSHMLRLCYRCCNSCNDYNCSCKAAYNQSICQKEQTSASPVIDICPVCYGFSTKTGNVRRCPDGWGEAAPPLTGLLYCADCNGKMYVHRTHNGRRRKAYPEIHRPILFNELVLSDKLIEHCAEIDEAARSRMELIVPEPAKRNGVTEQLKVENCSHFSYIFQSCGRIVHKFYGRI